MIRCLPYLDVGTMIYNNENPAILENNVKLINHIHMSEPNLVPIEKRDLHKELISLLKKENYEKYISIEMKQQDDTDKTEEILKYVKGLL